MVKEVDSVLKVGKELADYIVELSYEALSYDVTHQASRVILDSLATMYMGTRKEDAVGIIKFLEWNNAFSDCTVIGTSLKISVSGLLGQTRPTPKSMTATMDTGRQQLSEGLPTLVGWPFQQLSPWVRNFTFPAKRSSRRLWWVMM